LQQLCANVWLTLIYGVSLIHYGVALSASSVLKEFLYQFHHHSLVHHSKGRESGTGSVSNEAMSLTFKDFIKLNNQFGQKKLLFTHIFLCRLAIFLLENVSVNVRNKRGHTIKGLSSSSVNVYFFGQGILAHSMSAETLTIAPWSFCRSGMPS